MTALVTDNLPLVSSAPAGIAKLRELILVLAVHGKLVSHDPSDEAALELLKRTAHARAQRPRRGKTLTRPQVPDASKDWPYAIPSGWQWCRLADLVDVLNGRAYKKEELLNAGTPVLRVGNLFTSNHWYYSDLELDDDRYCLPGDLLYAWSASFGPFIWSGDRAIYHYHIWKLEPHSDADLNRRYLHTFLAEQTQAIKAAGHGVSMTHMTKEKMERIAVPVPPLAEQHRIVAKVDELMALCDRLEAEQADAEAAHAQLVQALLASLTQSRDAADFRASWHQLSEHFHTLFTTEASVDALKQAALQLAFAGRLVPQVEGEGSAKDMVKDIAGGLPGRRDPSTTNTVPDCPTLPTQWLWVRIEQISSVGTGATPSRTNPVYFDPPKHSWVTSGETSQRFVSETAEKVSDLALAETNLTVYPPGTLVVAMYGQGKTRGQVTELAISACTNQACAAIQLVCECKSHRKFVKYFFVKSYDDLRSQAAGGAQPNLNLGKIKETLLPLPPLAEQRRIVTKLDELFDLFDQLKLHLTGARSHHERLASVLVEQAVG